MTTQAEHLGVRPDWRCRICGLAWPCAVARRDLLAEFRQFPSLLRIYLAANHCAALGDLTACGQAPPADLYERFFGWSKTSATPFPPTNGFSPLDGLPVASPRQIRR